MLPVLVAASHGTASPEGRAAVAGLVDAVATRRPDLEVIAAFVDVQQPTPTGVLARLADRPARVVPLLLSAGYHVYVDLTAAVAPTKATLSGALGPDPRLAALLHARLATAGLRDTDVVIMAAAGSSEPRAVADCAAVATALGRLIGRPSSAAYLSAAQPRLREAVARAREEGERVVVATYLLAPGYFADLTLSCGADVVTAPLLTAGESPADALVDLVLDRYTDDAVCR